MFLVQHLGGHDEGLTHVQVGLGRRLDEELNVVLSFKLLTRLLGYLSLRFSVRLITHEDHDGVGL